MNERDTKRNERQIGSDLDRDGRNIIRKKSDPQKNIFKAYWPEEPWETLVLYKDGKSIIRIGVDSPVTRDSAGSGIDARNTTKEDTVYYGKLLADIKKQYFPSY